MKNKIKMLSRKDYYWMYDDEPGNFPYGYFIDDKLAGVIKITHTDNDDFYGLSEFIVYEEYRNKGIGTKLLQYVIGKYGKYDLILNVYIKNYKAISLYKKNGFKITYTNNNPDYGDEFYVMVRKSDDVKGRLNVTSALNVITSAATTAGVDSCLVRSDTVGFKEGALDGVSVTVTYNITDHKNPLTRKEIIDIIGSDNILNDLRTEYKCNGKEMPTVTIDDIDSFATEDNNRIIAEFTFDDYFDCE